MKGIVKLVWWKIPLYSVITGFVSWWLMVSYIGRLAKVLSTDRSCGSLLVAKDNTTDLAGKLLLFLLMH